MGAVSKFMGSHWVGKLQDEKFRNRVLEIMDKEIIMKFDKRIGEAQEFYTLDGEEE